MEELKSELKKIKKIFFYSLIAFVLIGGIAGLALASHQAFIEELVVGFVQDKADLFSPDGQILVWELFKNNLKAAFMSFGLGFIPFLFLPAFSLAINALVIGGVYVFVSSSMNLVSYILSLAPHGIFEIPAFLLAVSLGLSLCWNLTGRIFKKDLRPLGELLTGHIRVFVLLIIPLLLLAAFIESYLSPLFMGFLLG